jgi:hypothetical protein
MSFRADKALHPFIRWDTCVAYMLAGIISEQQLQDRLDTGESRVHLEVPADILALVLCGFLASEYTINGRQESNIRFFCLATSSNR